jgi:hypothetical protein
MSSPFVQARRRERHAHRAWYYSAIPYVPCAAPSPPALARGGKACNTARHRITPEQRLMPALQRATVAALLILPLVAQAGPLYLGAAAGRTSDHAPCAAGAACPGSAFGGGKLYLGYLLEPAAGGALLQSVEVTYWRGAGALAQDGRRRFDGLGAGYRAGVQRGAFGVSARAGVASMRALLGADSSTRFGLTYGVGMQYALTPQVAVTLDVDRATVAELAAAGTRTYRPVTTSFGLSYTFK